MTTTAAASPVTTTANRTSDNFHSFEAQAILVRRRFLSLSLYLLAHCIACSSSPLSSALQYMYQLARPGKDHTHMQHATATRPTATATTTTAMTLMKKKIQETK